MVHGNGKYVRNACADKRANCLPFPRRSGQAGAALPYKNPAAEMAVAVVVGLVEKRLQGVWIFLFAANTKSFRPPAKHVFTACGSYPRSQPGTPVRRAWNNWLINKWGSVEIFCIGSCWLVFVLILGLPE